MKIKSMARALISWKSKLGVLLAISIALVFLFQNCSNVDFETITELDRAGITGELRYLSLTPETFERRPNINLTAVIDDSYSMQPIQNQVASAMSQVTGQLKGFSGDFEIYTTSQNKDSRKHPDAKLSYQEKRYIEFVQGGKKKRLEWSQENLVPPSLSYDKVISYLISAPFTPAQNPLRFSANMGDSEFQEFSGRFSQAIRSVGTDGSDKEQGLCTLLRAIEAKSDTKSFETFLIAANEDDATELSSCLSQIRTPVKKIKKVPPQVSCNVGDPGCQYHYQVSYQRQKREHINYQYRDVVENVSYQINQPEEKQSIGIQYRRHRPVYKYERKTYKKWVTYTRYVLKDNLPIPESRERSHTLVNNSTGMCPGGSYTRSVSCDGLPSHLAKEGFVPGSCTEVCQDNLAASQKFLSYVGGSCSKSGLLRGSQRCTTEQEEEISRLLNISRSHLNSCDMDCQESTQSLTETLPTRPNNCPDDEGETNSCDENQMDLALEQARKQLRSVGRNDIRSCKLSCKVEYPTGIHKITNQISQCSGLPSDQNGATQVVNCNSRQKSAIAALKNVAKSDVSCTQSCSQTIRKRSVLLSDPSMCELGNQTCDSGELSLAKSNLEAIGLARGQVISSSCLNTCSNGASKKSCETSLGEANLCVGGQPIGALSQSCADPSFAVNSCKFTGGTKVGGEITYDKVVQKAQNISHLKEGSSVAEQVSDRLFKKFNKRFYLASFVVPPDDPNCQPQNDNIDPALNYKGLHDRIGASRGRVFPVCMNDYSPALEFVFNLITEDVKRSYIIDDINPENEFIWRITLVRENGSVEKLDKAQFTLNQNVLTFASSVNLNSLKRMDLEIVTEY